MARPPADFMTISNSAVVAVGAAIVVADEDAGRVSGAPGRPPQTA
jgi:hypothetical protein